ncbi:MAG: MBL fold metallo-hydrolase [Actinomycetota bacterium]
MLIAGFPSAQTGTNCFVVAPGDGEQCVVIDPGIGIGPRLDEVVAEHRLHPIAVLLTHGHVDHTFSVFPVCQARGVPAYIHPDDRGQLTDPWSALGLVPGTSALGLGGMTFAEPDDVRELSDGEQVPLAGLIFAVRHAPGHTPGSVVFATAEGEDPTLFSGDVLFAGSIGRVDLPGGSMMQMTASLRDVVLPLDDHTVVYPGHGPVTTIGRERTANPYLQGLG